MFFVIGAIVTVIIGTFILIAPVNYCYGFIAICIAFAIFKHKSTAKNISIPIVVIDIIEILISDIIKLIVPINYCYDFIAIVWFSHF